MICRQWTWGVAILTVLGAAVPGCMHRARPQVDYSKAFLDARLALRQAAEAPDPVTRALAIEALSQTEGAEAGPVFQEALRDPYPAVRFAAAMAIGDVRCEPAKPTLEMMAQAGKESSHAEPDKRVFCAVIYALHRLGDQRWTGELGSLLFDEEKEVRANAAMVMGRMQEPSAKVPLKTCLQDEQDPTVQLPIIESLAMLGDSHSAIVLEAYSKTQFLEDRLDAISAMARLKAPRSVRVLRDMLSTRQPPSVRVAAAGGLARLNQAGNEEYELCLEAAKNPEKLLRDYLDGAQPPQDQVRTVQRLAAISLGWMNRQEAVVVLRPLLESPDGGVRVAAAMSQVRLLQAYKPLEPPAPTPAETEEKAVPVETVKDLPKLHTAGGKE